MLAAVAAAAYATVPARFLTSPSRWTAADWSVHDQAMRACCDRALARNPQSAEAHTQLAGILYRQGKTNEAVSHLCTAVAANPDSSVFRSLGVIYLNLGQDDQAEKVFRKALALYPNDPGSHSYLGVILMKRGRQAEALEHYRQALAISPDFDERIKHLEAVLTLQEKEKGHHGP
jgi:Flp pilus assembly protein TadD